MFMIPTDVEIRDFVSICLEGKGGMGRSDFGKQIYFKSGQSVCCNSDHRTFAIVEQSVYEEVYGYQSLVLPFLSLFQSQHTPS